MDMHYNTIYILQIMLYIIYCYPPGLSTLFGQFWVEMTEVAHCPGCDASRPIRGECLVDAKVRRGLGLVPCPPKSPKAIHTLGVVVCRIINYKGTLVFERGTTQATTLPQRPTIGKVGAALLHPRYTLYRCPIEALEIVNGTLIDLYRGLLNPLQNPDKSYKES